MQQPSFDFAQRWRDHHEFRLRPGSQIDPREFGVEPIRERVARDYVIEHHYSASMLASRLCVGLMRKTGVSAARLVGVAVFSVPMNQQAVPCYTGRPAQQGVELGRFVCSPEVAFNGESFFIRRALGCLRDEKPEVEAVLSYADPVERHNRHGELIKCSHHGTIYQASNALYLGRGSSRLLILAADGSIVSERSLSKIRNEERGQAYARERLIAAGAPEPYPGESPRGWVSRVLAGTSFRRLRHPGNHVYVLGIDAGARRDLGRLHAERPPYPKSELTRRAA